jgi:hypothetical protein
MTATILICCAAFFAGYWLGLKHSEILFADAVRHINKHLDNIAWLIKTKTGAGKEK